MNVKDRLTAYFGMNTDGTCMQVANGHYRERKESKELSIGDPTCSLLHSTQCMVGFCNILEVVL